MSRLAFRSLMILSIIAGFSEIFLYSCYFWNGEEKSDFELVDLRQYLNPPNLDLNSYLKVNWLTILCGTSFSGANLTGANFEGSSLKYTSFSDSVTIKLPILGGKILPFGLDAREISKEVENFLDKLRIKLKQNVADLTHVSWHNARNLDCACFGSSNLEYPRVRDLLTSLNGVEKDLSYTDLRGVNIAYANLERVNLAGAKLEGSKLDSSNLIGANLAGAKLNGASLRNVLLREANLFRANLMQADLCEAFCHYSIFNEANFGQATLRRVDFGSASLKNTYLVAAEIDESSFVRADLEYANLTGSSLSRANLSWANLNFVNLMKASLYGAICYRSSFVSANLIQANLSHADFTSSNLDSAHASVSKMQGANFSRASLRSADFSECDLSASNFEGACLTAVNFKNADLNGAHLKDADLSDATLNDACLFSADLSFANLSRSQVLYTRFTQSVMTGVCISDWQIGSCTVFKAVKSNYIFRSYNNELLQFSGRLPVDPKRTFGSGEFEKWMEVRKEALDTIDITFTDGIDWQALFQSLQAVRQRYPDAHVSMQAVEENNGIVVARLKVETEVIDETRVESEFIGETLQQLKAEVESQFKASYELKLAEVRGQIKELRVSKDSLENLLKEAIMSPKYRIEQVGNLADVNHGNMTATIQNYYGQDADTIMQKLEALRESAQSFPEAVKGVAQDYVEDLARDLQQTEKPSTDKLKRRLIGLLGVAVALGTHIATATDFANNVLELADKLAVPTEALQPQLQQLKAIHPEFDWQPPE